MITLSTGTACVIPSIKSIFTTFTLHRSSLTPIPVRQMEQPLSDWRHDRSTGAEGGHHATEPPRPPPGHRVRLASFRTDGNDVEGEWLPHHVTVSPGSGSSHQTGPLVTNLFHVSPRRLPFRASGVVRKDGHEPVCRARRSSSSRRGPGRFSGRAPVPESRPLATPIRLGPARQVTPPRSSRAVSRSSGGRGSEAPSSLDPVPVASRCPSGAKGSP